MLVALRIVGWAVTAGVILASCLLLGVTVGLGSCDTGPLPRMAVVQTLMAAPFAALGGLVGAAGFPTRRALAMAALAVLLLAAFMGLAGMSIAEECSR